MNNNLNYIDSDFKLIFKDYTNKLREKFDNDKSSSINNMVILLNWSFFFKNNFFVEKFNNKYVHNVCESYNMLKTNILGKSDNNDIFDNINESELRRLKFILFNYVQSYNKISTDPKNKMLVSVVNVESIRDCIYMINNKINQKTTNIISKL